MTPVVQNEHLTRQMDIIDIGRLTKQEVNIVGAGAIGSFVALELAKMGVQKISVWDHDEVSIENMNNQFFRYSDIGKKKTLALFDLVKDFTNTEIRHFPVRFGKTDGAMLHGIVVSAVDSMDARKMIFDGILESGNANVAYIIDPRMSAESYTQYVTNLKDNVDSYKTSLYTDGEAVQERCTAKSTIYTATLAAGMVTKTIKNMLMGEPHPKSIQWNINLSSQHTLSMFPNRT